MGYEMNEPVAWMDGQGNLFKHPDDADRGQTMRPLYLEHEWVNLTDDEINDALADVEWGELLLTVICLTKLIEAKSKRKNHD